MIATITYKQGIDDTINVDYLMCDQNGPKIEFGFKGRDEFVWFELSNHKTKIIRVEALIQIETSG